MALAAIDTEAEEESGINRELAAVMCTRMDAARRATEKLLGVLQVGLKTSLPEHPHQRCLYVNLHHQHVRLKPFSQVVTDISVLLVSHELLLTLGCCEIIPQWPSRADTCRDNFQERKLLCQCS